MKMKKKLLSLSLALALVCSNFTGVLAKDVSDYIVKLQDAKMLEMDKINKYNMNGDLSIFKNHTTSVRIYWQLHKNSY